jgi:hypothetical protein
MMKDSQKTIPYSLSQAELENLRLLRERSNPSISIQDDDEENKPSQEVDEWNSDRSQFDNKTEKKTR